MDDWADKRAKDIDRRTVELAHEINRIEDALG
jgi:hypothetical protein